MRFKTVKARLLCSTAIASFYRPSGIEPSKSAHSKIPAAPKIAKPPSTESRQTQSKTYRPSGRESSSIIIQRDLKCPPLTESEIAEINNINCGYLTRHFVCKYLSSVREGYFRFGTIQGYRPADKALVGRFSDLQEGAQLKTFRNRTGDYEYVRIDDIHSYGARTGGADNQITVEYQMDEYCSCSSIGDFDLERAKSIRENGNPDLSAYAVYDVNRLIEALAAIIAETSKTKSLRLIGRRVAYGAKDIHFHVGSSFAYDSNKNPLRIWLETVFVKARDYQHEEELRIVLVNPERVGTLPLESDSLYWTDPRIKDALIYSNPF